MSDYNLNESNYDPRTNDNAFNNDTTFSRKRFGELVLDVNELKRSSENNNVGGNEISVGTGLVNDNGTIRLAMLHGTSYNNGQIIINIDSQYDTPYSYDDDYDGEGTEYEDNPTPYVIDLSQNEYKFNSVELMVSKFMMTQEQVDALKPHLKSVFAKVYWKSDIITNFTHVPSSSAPAWVSNGFSFSFNIPSRSTNYPSEEIFDTIERIELVMTNSTNTNHSYGYSVGTFFPAGSSILVNGTYFA